MRLFALKGSDELGRAAASPLGRKLDPHEEREFEDGEHKARPLVGVRGEDVYVIHSLAGSEGSANDRLCRLLFFIATCRDQGASRVTAVVPYLAYWRKDRRTKARDPVTTRYVAQLFEAVGTDRIVTLEAHNVSAFENAFRCETVHLDCRKLFVAEIERLARSMPVVLFSPDGGGVKRAQLLKEEYDRRTGAAAGFGFMEKRRSRGRVSGDLFAGDVAGSAVFIVDDMIGTGGTMLRAAHACRERGAAAVHALATHGLFGPRSDKLLSDTAINRILVTDTVARAASVAAGASTVPVGIVPVGPLIGEAIGRLATGGSISELLGTED